MTNTRTPAVPEAVPTVTEHSNLAAALAAVQAVLPPIAKNARADVKSDKGNYSYTYADLSVITPLILPLLGANGLSFSSRPTIMGEAFVLHYSLAHTSGDALEGVYPLPDPLRARAQEIGSAITYARRYALCAVTGIAPGDDDDDAAAASNRPAADAKPKAPEKPPIAKGEWGARILDVNDTVALRDVFHEVEEAGELGLRFNAAQWKFVEETASFHKLPKPPRDVTVAQLINVVGNALKDKVAEDPAPAAEGEAGWPTAEIPKDEES